MENERRYYLPSIIIKNNYFYIISHFTNFLYITTKFKHLVFPRSETQACSCIQIISS